MNAVMLSIRPKWCELIANGKKTIDAVLSLTGMTYEEAFRRV